MQNRKGKFSDGYLDLVVMKDCPKLSLVTLMSGLNKGGHVRSPHVLYLKVKAFTLEPGSRADDPNKEGIIDVDGEVLARGRGTYKCDQKITDGLRQAPYQSRSRIGYCIFAYQFLTFMWFNVFTERETSSDWWILYRMMSLK
ncbi:hypothetical protein HAX54_012804 [Datura stramonium]|uniref:YegS/DAGK C-terminal domain-containing protein n=1 Tax=Datura stramonium TaxID=4076 RepID=A0ABS8TN78_DATST|nr:hypothetical protein [Datura stramonium]